MNITFLPTRGGRTQHQRAVLEAGDLTAQIEVVMWANNREDMRKARVYVDGEVDVDFTEAYALQRANGFVAKGENAEEDKLFAKLNREVVKNKKAVFEEALTVFPELAEMFLGKKVTFSRTAGCGCGCSPAFVPSSQLGATGTYQDFGGERKEARHMKVTNVWITKKAA
ncbi:hypothetical protein SEA_VITAS_47 [Microbacterium phage Vitas]|uniref:Uncharacterized protein n=1 Tax=Microbacterium phage Vitas TaxID=2603259 RepID=A0A5B8WFC1_9CAUD|nr:hypothetical protein SEA_VITAS_47 [Microbacterium phage Vitas]